MSLVQKLRSVTVIALALVLAGCAGTQASVVPTSAPSKSPSATATPSPDPDTVVASVVLSGSAISTENGAGEQLESIPFAPDASSAIATLADAFGEAPFEYEQSGCRIGNYYAWGTEAPAPNVGRLGLTLHTPDGGVEFTVSLSAPEVSGVELHISTGQSVGDDVSALLADPGADFNREGYSGSFMWDVTSYRVTQGIEFPFGGVGMVSSPDTTLIQAAAPAGLGAFYC